MIMILTKNMILRVAPKLGSQSDNGWDGFSSFIIANARSRVKLNDPGKKG